MSDYTKQLPSGRYLAKRGNAYYLYNSLQDVQFDDAWVAENLKRLQQGVVEWCYNRAIEGLWYARAARLRDIQAIDAGEVVIHA